MNEMDGYWERLARPWLDNEAAMEELLVPLGTALDAALALAPGEAVLEVGPGSGAGLMRLRAAVGPQGRVTGVDIAPPFAARASVRTGEKVVVADAGVAPVEAGAFDAVASQLGLMFFDDPVAGFASVGANLRPGGRLATVAWGPRPQNPLFAVPGRVAAELFGPPPPADPDAPGAFGLQNAARTTGLLAEAGFVDVRVTPVGLTLASSLDAAGFAAVQTEVGPAAGRLREAGGGTTEKEALGAELARAFAAFECDGGLALPALAHVYEGRWP